MKGHEASEKRWDMEMCQSPVPKGCRVQAGRQMWESLLALHPRQGRPGQQAPSLPSHLYRAESAVPSAPRLRLFGSWGLS